MVKTVFQTDLLDEILKRKELQREKDRCEMINKILNVLPELSEKYGFEQASLFGSLVCRGRFTKKSDIDMAVSGLPKKLYFKLLCELSGILGREVDLVEMVHLRFSEKVLRGGIVWKR